MTISFSRLIAVAVLTFTATAAIPPAEKLLPTDTLFLISIPDCTKARDNYEKSFQGKFFNDPAMKPIREKFMEKFKNDFVTPLERELGIKLDDYNSMSQGQFTFAITQEGWTGEGTAAPARLLLLDTREKSSQLKTNLANLRKKWVESGRTLKTEKIRSVEFIVLPLSSNNVPKTIRDFFPQSQEVKELGKESPPKSETPIPLYIGQYDSLLIAGDSAGAVEKVVAHLTGGSVPALADEALFEADRLALFRDAPLVCWFNAKRFVGVLMSLPADEPNPEAPSLMPQFDMHKVLPALGLSCVKTVAVTARYSDAGSFYEVFVGAPESARQGLVKILGVPAKDSGPPPFVPADSVKFERFRIDGQQAMATVEKMLGDISPQMANMFNFFLNSPALQGKDPDFNLKKELFGNLGDDYIAWSKAARGNAAELAPAISLIGSPNGERLVAAIKSLLSVLPSMAELKERDFLGRKIYTLNLSAPRGRGRTNTSPSALSFAVSGSYVAFSMDAALLEEYLRSNEGPAKPLRELPGLAEAAQRVGGLGTGTFTYENQAETMRVAFQQLKASALKGTNAPADFNPLVSAMPFTHPEKSFKSWLDYSLLPDFDRVSKYFYFTVFSSSTTVNGISFKAFTPTPPALR